MREIEIENKKIADYILENNATLRETAKHFGISRQTACNRMKIYDDKQINDILQEHFKNKYIKRRNSEKK